MLGIGGFWLGLILSVLAACCFLVAVVAGAIWAWHFVRRQTNPATHAPLGVATQERWREQERLDVYFAQMKQWLHNTSAPLRQSSLDPSIRASAQEDTARILRGLSPDGKREVVRFLHRQQLIKVGTAIISLAHADLGKADLSGLGLPDTALSYANLSNADLSDACLSNIQATETDIRKAAKRRATKMLAIDLLEVELSQPIDVSHLIQSDLSGAVLKRTQLTGCKLCSADFAGADLDEADIRAADLRGADNLTQEQIESAYGSRDQQGDMLNTLLPNGLEAPLLWKLSLDQQKAVRQRKS